MVISGWREARTGNASAFASYQVRDHGVNKLVKNWNDVVQLKEPTVFVRNFSLGPKRSTELQVMFLLSGTGRL